MRHVDDDRARTVRPANSWIRRAPVRLADACVGLLAAAVANRASQPTELFLSYGEAHARRVLPPMVATIGTRIARRLGPRDLVRILKQAYDVRIYLSRSPSDDPPVEGDSRLRALFNALITRLELDLPPEAVDPVIDHFVAMVLNQWTAECDSRSSQTPKATEPARP